jgi:5'(3')-deoxyribonucleotidase
MSKEIIAVDIDEVLFPFIDEFIKDHDARFGTSLDKNHFDTYEFSAPLGLDVPTTIERVYAFQKRIDSKISEPFEESKEAVAKLSKHYELAVVTARHPQFEDMTIEWLREHYKSSFVSITHIGFAPIMEKPITKAAVCLELGAIALIDDSIDHILQCSKSDIEGVLFGNYPWNQTNALPPNVTRCTSWLEVLEHFELQA